MATTSDFSVGDPVVFGRANGEQTRGTVVKVNRKTLLVQQDEGRGTRRGYDVGTKWKVPPSLCRHADRTHTSVSVPVKPTRPEVEIMRDILRVYGGLSPENLSCDGELSSTQIRRRAANLRSRLRELEQEFGRKVSEEEAYAWYETNRGA